MDLKLNNSELAIILNFCDVELSEDVVDPMMKATIKTLLTKINNQIEFQHHNQTDDFVTSLISYHYTEAI